MCRMKLVRKPSILVILGLLCLMCLSRLATCLDIVVQNRTVIRLPGSVLSFTLFAPTESVSATALLMAKNERGSVRLCLLVDAEPCDCVKFWPGASVHKTQTGVMGKFSTILSPRCATEREFFSFAVEVEAGQESEVSAPLYEARQGSLQHAHELTLVLPLTKQDTSRALVLLKTLKKVPAGVVREMLVFCPDAHTQEIQAIIEGHFSGPERTMDAIAFPLRVLEESSLFGGTAVPAGADKYGLQMAVKLLAADRVQTPFYITLDADCVLLKPHLLRSVLYAGGRKALFEDEARAVHPLWWRGSAALLGSPQGVGPRSALDDRPHSGFGVTPSVLSKMGALITVRDVLRRLVQCFPARAEPPQWLWLLSFARPYVPKSDMVAPCWPQGESVIWSEYTLYRLALDSHGMFSALHLPAAQPRPSEERYNSVMIGQEGQATMAIDAVDSSLISPALHCYDVWYSRDLPWKAKAALSPSTPCLFSVVQSSSQVQPAVIEQQLRLEGYID